MSNTNILSGLSSVQKCLYYMAYGIILLISLLPFRILYGISDCLYLLVYKIVGYRRKIVEKNLKESFPEKSDVERREISRQFYHWFCDYMVETIKLASISSKEMNRRMQFEGKELINEACEKGQSVTLYLGHYCNWEWISSLGMHIPQGIMGGQIYHPLENKVANSMFLRIRGRFGVKSIAINDTLTTLLKWKKIGKLSITGYIADQVPGFSSMHYWPTFLNHKTATFSGPERISRILNTTVLYIDISRPKRGYYIARFVKITDNPTEEKIFSITEQYYRLLEATIKNAPPYWLWSHNRWKRGWKEFCECYPDEKDRARIMSKL